MSVRLIGFGARVELRGAFRLERGAGETTLRAWDGERDVELDVDALLRGEQSTELFTASGGDDQAREWTIETDVLACAWPSGFALCSDPDGVSPFLLVGSGDAMLWISGPLARETCLPIEQLAGDDQTVRAIAETSEGDARIDLDYVIDGELWWQRRYVVTWEDERALVLSAQSKASDEERVRAAIDELESSLEPTAPRAADLPS
ncbi:MAG: hypothetical protein M3Y87_14740 [Myxococcota bacterium]|nr:hypothetical protein [Myxococcota bacterium]